LVTHSRCGGYMWTYFFGILFWAIPLVVTAFFGVSLFRYLYARKRNKQAPGVFSAEEMKKRKLILTVASVLAGVLLMVVAGFVALLFMAVAFM